MLRSNDLGVNFPHPSNRVRPEDVERERIAHEQEQTEPGPEDLRLYTDTGLPADELHDESVALTPAEAWARCRPFGLDDADFLATRQEAINQNLFLWRVSLWNDNVVWAIGKDKNDAVAKSILAGSLRPKDVIRDFDECPRVEMVSTETGNPTLTICRTEPEVRFTIEQFYSDTGWNKVGKVYAGSVEHALEIARVRWINLGNIRAALGK